MKNKTHLLIIALITISATIPMCKSATDKWKEKITKDSMDRDLDKKVEKRLAEIERGVLEDTAGMTKAPIIISKAEFVSKTYSNYRSVSLTYKNVSDKNVTAIRFSWKGTNSFGEPADAGSISHEGYGGGFADELTMKPGETETGEWDILSKDGRIIVMAWPTEVVFSDGTKWLIKEKK